MRRTVLALALVSAAAPAWAHAFLSTATPAVGSTIQQAPSQVVINFTEGVEPAFSTITVQDAAGQRVDAGDARRDGPETRLAVPLKTLQPGTYSVTWHATAVDTHKTEGHYTFSIAP